jgi:type IVB pilus formation R64 PilN family outer membrane protein
MIITKTATALACAALLAGCTGLTTRIEQDINSAQQRARDLRGPANQAHAGTPAVVKDAGFWLGSQTVKIDKPETLPAVLQQPASFDRAVSGLGEIAERLSIRTGIPVRVAADAQGAAAAPAASGGVRMTYGGGSVAGLLDAVAARWGVSWKYEAGHITFFLHETRSYTLFAVAGEATMNAKISASAVGAGSTSSSSSSSGKPEAGFTGQMAIWTNVEKALTAMLSTGGRLAVSPATGSITVSDTPRVQERVSAYLQEQNKALSRQVVLNVTVLAVSLKDVDAYGIDWALVYRTASAQFGITSNLASTAGTAANTLSANVLSTSSSKFAGSSAIIQALSEQGRVRKETAAAVTALNFQPVPLQVIKQTGYVASVATTQVATAGTQTSITPGTVVSGFNMTLLPYIQENGTVMLQFGTELSALRNLTTFSSGANSVQLPELDTRSFLQRVSMRSGETLVVSGFEQTDDNLQRSGLGTARNVAAGGRANGQAEKEIIVIVITPVVTGERGL